jgi:hypothetical protein
MRYMARKEQSRQKSKSALGLIAKSALTALVLITAVWFNADASSNVEELQRKIADITLLKGQLGDRQQQAEAALEALLKQQNDLLAEVHVLIKSLKIKTFHEAQQHLRMRYDMELLGTIAAYRQAFETKIRFYQTGRGKLTYLKQLADDDAKMIATLSDFRIDALATQISLVINQYLKEAHAIQIDPQHIEVMPSKGIWEDIAEGK